MDTGRFKIIHKKTVNSTNTWAKQEEITNVVFLADYQTDGRGRLSRKWESPKGKNLYFSIKIQINDYNQAIDYNFLTSLAIAEALDKEYKLKTTIKWPNDLLIDNKKFSGLLSEIDSSKKGLNLVIGIGINCNFDIKGSNIEKIATSLHYYLGEIDKRILLNKVLERFYILNEEYKKMEKNIKLEKILKKWNKYANIEGRSIYTTILDKKEMVKVIKLNNDASITVERKDGSTTKLIAGDIEYVKKNNNKKLCNNKIQ